MKNWNAIPGYDQMQSRKQGVIQSHGVWENLYLVATCFSLGLAVLTHPLFKVVVSDELPKSLQMEWKNNTSLFVVSPNWAIARATRQDNFTVRNKYGLMGMKSHNSMVITPYPHIDLGLLCLQLPLQRRHELLIPPRIPGGTDGSLGVPPLSLELIPGLSEEGLGRPGLALGLA